MRLILILPLLVLFQGVARQTLAAPTGEALRAGFALASDPMRARAALFDAEPLTRDLLSWVILRGGHDAAAGLADHMALMARHPEWPVDPVMQRAAEATMTVKTPSVAVLAYFLERRPKTAKGFAALLRAYGAAGAVGNARALVAELWPELSLDARDLPPLVAEFGPLLAQHHGARTDALLWAGRAGEARDMAYLLTPEQRADLAARLAYMQNSPKAGVMNAGQGETPALAYARFDWLARQGSYTKAIDWAMTHADPAHLGQPARWAKWRARLARWLLRSSKGMQAYELADKAFTTPQDGYIDAELDWIAGYAALSALNAPALALEHWQRFEGAVSTPISQGRAWYWIARAEAARGNAAAAAEARAQAARHQVSFYGQIAAEEAGLPFDPGLIQGALGQVAAGDNDPVLAALDVLVQADERGLAYAFAEHLGDQASPEVLRAGAARMLAREGYFFALRLGKAAAGRGEIIPEAYFPLHPLAQVPDLRDRALALAIARQESEFRTDAGSSAGALGLMQLMPATAELMAKAEGVAFEQGKLATDWAYNAKLGAAYLERLKEDFGDSPLLIAAAYNAGPNRARTWIASAGDPRDPAVDPVAWIEAIPFDETRNYVMRVLEAIRPYEARLTGQAPTRSMAQLLRGAYPLVRPRARPEALSAPAQVSGEATVSRPRARP